MRVATVSSCLVIVAAVALAASVSAQPSQQETSSGKSVPLGAQFHTKPQKDAGPPRPKVLSPTSPGRPKNMPTTTVPKGSKLPLTAKDCTDLGGTVQQNTLCNSGSSCARIDQNGKVHHVCLNAK